MSESLNNFIHKTWNSYLELRLFLNLHLRICFLIWERERERSIGCLLYEPQLGRVGIEPITYVCALTGNQASNILVYRTALQPITWLELELRPFKNNSAALRNLWSTGQQSLFLHTTPHCRWKPWNKKSEHFSWGKTLWSSVEPELEFNSMGKGISSRLLYLNQRRDFILFIFIYCYLTFTLLIYMYLKYIYFKDIYLRCMYIWFWNVYI